MCASHAFAVVISPRERPRVVARALGVGPRRARSIARASRPRAMARDASTASAVTMIELLRRARGLKTLPRAGWAERRVREVESVADHTFRVALCAMLTSSSEAARAMGVDSTRAVKMALVHDLAECVVGDITPCDGVSDDDKHAMEKRAMDDLVKDLGSVGLEVLELWEEYEAGTSATAKLVKDCDKLEMVLQAQEYESEGNAGERGTLEEFFESTRGRYRTTIGTEMSEEIEKGRPGRE